MAGPDEKLVKLSEDEAARLLQLYSDAETEILREINRGLLKGDDLRYMQKVLANVQAILEDLRNGSRTWCEQAIPLVYTEGINFADSQEQSMGADLIAGFAAIHQQAAQVLAENAYQRLTHITTVIGRRVDDIYRQTALEAVRSSVIGYDTWKRVAENYRSQLAEQGITGFKDAAGRDWNMKTYSEMVARTTTMEAHLQGTANRLLEYGQDLVKVSTHNQPCELCQPWQGRILSITGKTPGYPTLEEAKAKGLFHPNCRHAYGLYLPD